MRFRTARSRGSGDSRDCQSQPWTGGPRRTLSASLEALGSTDAHAGIPRWDRDNRVTLANWQAPPFNRWSFSHLRELVATQPIRNHGFAHPVLSEPDVGLSALPVGRLDGTTSTFLDLLHDTYTDSVVIMHHDRIRYEQYFGHTQPHTAHLLMSVTKSVVGCVAGILTTRGVLKEHELLTTYVPELAGSGITGATVRTILDMRSGVKFRAIRN